MATTTVTELREQRVMEWLSKSGYPIPQVPKSPEVPKHPEVPESSGSPQHSPHYDPDSDEPESIIIETPFDPSEIPERLKFCPICYQMCSTPEDTIACITKHRKHLCYFCFECVDSDPLTVTRHYRRKRHFCDQTDFNVKCPFKDCLTPEIEYGFMQIQRHVMKVHLPTAYSNPDDLGNPEVADIQMQFDGSESEKVDTKKAILKFLNSKKTDGGLTKLKKDECLKFEETYDKMGKELAMVALKLNSCGNGTKDEMDQEASGIVDESMETIGSSTDNPTSDSFFACSFCEKVFCSRKGLINHNVQRKCKNLQDKRCSGCNGKFEGFSILDCVTHLLKCPKSHRLQQGGQPRGLLKLKKQVVC